MLGLKITIEKSVEVNQTIDQMMTLLSDLSTFRAWSPWSCLDDNTKIEIGGEKNTIGHFQTWESEFTGSGNMTISKISQNRIDLDLEFFKPFQTKSKTWFLLQAKDSSTIITWGMESKLSIFMFFFKKMMTAYLGNDFERGLTRLKELAETGKVNCVLSDVVKVEQPELFYIGEHHQCSFADLKIKMNQSFDKIMKDIEARKIPIPNGFVSIYHKIDPINGQCDVTTSVFYYQKENDVPGYENKVLPKHHALRVNLSGPYIHLPSAWGKISVFQRVKKFDLNKPLPMYEIYHNSPKMVEPKDVLTEIRLPVH